MVTFDVILNALEPPCVFKEFGAEGVRVRRVELGRHQGARIWLGDALGFEDLGLEHARLRGFGPGAL